MTRLAEARIFWRERADAEEAFARRVTCPFCHVEPGAPCRRVPQSALMRARRELGELLGSAHVTRMVAARKADPVAADAMQREHFRVIRERIAQIEAAHDERPAAPEGDD